jgi:hypothetical protein
LVIKDKEHLMTMNSLLIKWMRKKLNFIKTMLLVGLVSRDIT